MEGGRLWWTDLKSEKQNKLKGKGWERILLDKDVGKKTKKIKSSEQSKKINTVSVLSF